MLKKPPRRERLWNLPPARTLKLPRPSDKFRTEVLPVPEDRPVITHDVRYATFSTSVACPSQNVRLQHNESPRCDLSLPRKPPQIGSSNRLRSIRAAQEGRVVFRLLGETNREAGNDDLASHGSVSPRKAVGRSRSRFDDVCSTHYSMILMLY